MLQSLFIQNFAIIETLEVKFEAGMNVITGETGAGKSILLGAFSLVLGERADTKLLLDPEKKCVIEAVFSSLKDIQLEWSEDFDFDNQIILRREIAPNGKSRAFINNTPATLVQIKEIGELLVNRHSQHETLDLIGKGFQLNVLDTFSGIKEDVKKYASDFQVYKKNLRALDALKQKLAQQSKEEDFFQFQLHELEEAHLQEGELEALEEEQKILTNTEELQIGFQKALYLINESEIALLRQLGELSSTLKSLANTNTELTQLYNSALAMQEELRDTERSLEKFKENTEPNPERLEEVNQRLSLLYRLIKRHQVSTVGELIAIEQQLAEKLSQSKQDSTQIETLEEECTQQLEALQKSAQKLHKQRADKVGKASAKVTELLHQVGMPAATFDIALTALPDVQLNENGQSEITFLFSANKGFAPKPLKEVASGGELSRLMLCIKSLLADADHTPTLVFDEIDAGISGEVALQVGDIMKQLALHHQLICITHLPQIARCGDKHLFVYKEDSAERTRTNIRVLNRDERQLELAKMIGGDNYTDAALVHAKELLKIN